MWVVEEELDGGLRLLFDDTWLITVFKHATYKQTMEINVHWTSKNCYEEILYKIE